MIKIELPITEFKAVTKYKQLPIYFFRYDKKITENDTIVCSENIITIKDVTYEKMVDALIDIKYSISAQLALLYNYQKDPETYSTEMEEYQNWRTYCKESAREYFEKN